MFAVAYEYCSGLGWKNYADARLNLVFLRFDCERLIRTHFAISLAKYVLANGTHASILTFLLSNLQL